MMMHKDGIHIRTGYSTLEVHKQAMCFSVDLHPGIDFFLEFSNSASLYSSGRFAVSSCVYIVVKLEAELHKLEEKKRSSKWTVQTFYGALFPANTSGTHNTAMCVHYSSRQLGAGGCW